MKSISDQPREHTTIGKKKAAKDNHHFREKIPHLQDEGLRAS
ncbi:hypothetical protein [Oceanobacillus sp. FSL W7-1309]|nr:hypothetical protein [Oceanobacillus profundus]